MEKWKYIEDELQRLKENNLYRTMKVIESSQKSHVKYNGKDILMMASNSYLDLCDEERVKDYAIQMLKRYGTGSGGSRLTTGTTNLHIELEQTLARFKKREAALVFNTGFATNSSIIPALCKEGDVIYSDELNHASIIDGCRHSKALVVIYKHNDMEDLEQKIIENSGKQGLIVSDAVFSMDGDILNLPDFIKLAEKYKLLSMIDEAHSTGVLGKTGHGCEEYYAMEGKTDILMGTLSKAIGTEGGYVCGSKMLIEYLKNKSRSYIFSTSLSPVSIAAAKRSLELIEEEPQRVEKLQGNICWFCECLKKNGINVSAQTAIIPIHIGEEKKALYISEWLMECGYFVSAIRYPAVKKGHAILRIALMSSHTREELEKAAQVIAKAVLSC